MKISKISVDFVLSALFIAVIHFFLSYITAFSAGIGGGTVYVWASRILTFPLWLIPGDGSSENASLVGWLPLVFLSLVWGLLISFGLRFLFVTNTR